MAETSRTKAELLANLPDNVIGSISPEDVRDVVATVMGSYASIKVVEGVTAQVVNATPQKMTGWAANGLAVGCVPDHTTDDITVDVDGVYDLELACSFSGSNSKTYYLAFYVNGVDAGEAYIDRKLGTGGDVGSGGTVGRVSVTATDTIEVYVWSDDGGTSFTPHNACLKIKRIG